ncbi:MAG: TonB-dependent receptor, partial [Gammaproteobacteria bacterium]
GYLPSTNLQPEEIETYEFDLEHYFSNNFKFTASLYSNQTTNLIRLNSDVNTGDIFYDNFGDVDAVGTDLEIEYIAESGLKLRTSYSFADTEDRDSGMRLTNSPEHMAKLNLNLPVFQQKAVAGLEFRYMSHRTTPLGDKLGGFGITNLTLGSQKVYDRLELSASIYNLFDKQYADPASEEHVQSGIMQDGRNFRVKATYTF